MKNVKNPFTKIIIDKNIFNARVILGVHCD